MKTISDTDRRFWAAIGIGSGLSIFFFGINAINQNSARGWVTIGAALVMIIAGFCLTRKKSQSNKT